MSDHVKTHSYAIPMPYQSAPRYIQKQKQNTAMQRPYKQNEPPPPFPQNLGLQYLFSNLPFPSKS